MNLDKLIQLLLEDKRANPSNSALVVLSEGAEWEGYAVHEYGEPDAYRSRHPIPPHSSLAHGRRGQWARKQASLIIDEQGRWYTAVIRSEAAHDLLAPVYGWFTEGFDTVDLKNAEPRGVFLRRATAIGLPSRSATDAFTRRRLRRWQMPLGKKLRTTPCKVGASGKLNGAARDETVAEAARLCTSLCTLAN